MKYSFIWIFINTETNHLIKSKKRDISLHLAFGLKVYFFPEKYMKSFRQICHKIGPALIWSLVFVINFSEHLYAFFTNLLRRLLNFLQINFTSQCKFDILRDKLQSDVCNSWVNGKDCIHFQERVFFSGKGGSIFFSRNTNRLLTFMSVEVFYDWNETNISMPHCNRL